jgi:hypothetical protein
LLGKSSLVISLLGKSSFRRKIPQKKFPLRKSSLKIRKISLFPHKSSLQKRFLDENVRSEKYFFRKEFPEK